MINALFLMLASTVFFIHRGLLHDRNTSPDYHESDNFLSPEEYEQETEGKETEKSDAGVNGEPQKHIA